jgi:hypothetical protein
MAVTTNINGRSVDATYDNVKDTFPLSTAGAGTVSTVNGLNKKVVGVGTAFTSDFQTGDFIWFKTADELCEVENIVSDTELTLRLAPATTATADTYGIVSKSSYEFASWTIDSVGTAEINKVAYPAQTSNGDERKARRLEPFLIDSTANANIVYVKAR